MKNILITLPANEQHKAQLEAAAEGGIACAFIYAAPEDVTEEQLAWAHAIIGAMPPARLKHAANLEWLQLNSAGFDNYVLPGVVPEKAILTNASGAYGLAVGEHMLAFTFASIRHFPEYARNQHDHRWQDAGNIISVEGSTVLVLGVGDIGGFYARKMHALGATVIGVRRTLCEPCEDYLAEQHALADLDDVLPRADVVATVLPGGPETYHLMDERRLRLMKPQAHLINVGRGTAVDPEALKAVLAEGLLGGVAIDVTEPEPLPVDDELWDIPRVLITPHIAGYYYLAETLNRIVNIAAANLRAWTHGEPLTHVVERSR